MRNKVSCVDCGVTFSMCIGGPCCRRHKRSCPDCSVQDHIDGMEHRAAIEAKIKFEKPRTLVKVR